MSTMAAAIRRGIMHGIYLSATADTSRLRKMRKEIEESDPIAEAWQDVGDAMRESMNILDTDISENSSK